MGTERELMGKCENMQMGKCADAWLVALRGIDNGNVLVG
jgi:hypothetical protein